MLPASTIFLAGPTASGKSALALELASRLDGEIVNADAFQLYAGLDMLTAKPSAADFTRVPHHLYGVLRITEACDAQRYHDLAKPVIEEITSRGKTPLVVGGSGLYLKALTHGLAPLPQGDATMREKLRERSLEDKVSELLALDPAAATTVNLRNPRYVERALEICLLTGQPQSELRQGFQNATPAIRGLVIIWEREALCRRIEARTRQMLANGALEEVAALGEVSFTACKAIGIREIRDHLACQLTREQTIEAIAIATRQYAKRQATWFRRETCYQTICLDSSSTAQCPLESALRLFSSF
ncbi:MAG: tRNA (adenosine(37)-N6)-dimethylallyltransferase MiaA [Verrucomicrobiaceae bacterium]|nr:tRNA (adenosine(37)-N6)-dimethylallyltransferase MiaA [Verrucomicrobiaceae bacterium]